MAQVTNPEKAILKALAALVRKVSDISILEAAKYRPQVLFLLLIIVIKSSG